MNHYFYKIEKGLEDFLSCKQTLYANPLITINDKGYTKHYFEEGKRICSKIGSGELRDINDLVGHMEMNYEEQLNMQYDGIRDMRCLQSAWFDLENNNLYDHIIQTYENPMNPDEPIFYYHSYHLGSASFLTDRDGKETQQLVYLPFGELRSNREYLNVKNQNSHEQHWVDMKYNTSQYDTPYKFNGNEKDEETGYNNYGARYYYDWASIWLSVDPMSDKYPHLTSYNYCANNPVKYIDPNGKDIVDAQGRSMYQNGKRTEHATNDAQRIGNAMMQTKTGTEQFNKLVDSKAKIQLQISQEIKIKESENGMNIEYTFGEMQDAIGLEKEGDYFLTSAKIVIFEGSINKFIEDAIYSGSYKNDEIMTSTINNNQIIGAVGAHEVEHTTSENLKISKQGGDVEKKPNEIGSQVYRETKELNKQNNK